MNRNKETYGVDISKDVFDVHGSLFEHKRFKNEAYSFVAFAKAIPKDALVVIQATGYYH